MTDKYLDPSNLQRVWASITSRLGGKADQADMDAVETAIGNHAASIATVEQATATANHAVGDYFMVGNVLMRATSAIASGEQITSSNATPATVQGQIDSLRESVSRYTAVTATTSSTGAVPYSALGISESTHIVICARITSSVGYAFLRVGGYLMCFDNSFNPIANTSVTIEYIAVKRT